MVTEIKMPQLSETMIEGEIMKWLKGKRDDVKRSEPLLEVETDKAIREVAVRVSGNLLDEILVSECYQIC